MPSLKAQIALLRWHSNHSDIDVQNTMSRLPPVLRSLPFPVIGSPLFIISTPTLVIAQCIAGVVGSMPALNARPAEQLEQWLIEITETLAALSLIHI